MMLTLDSDMARKKKKEIIPCYIFKRYVYKYYLIDGFKQKKRFSISLQGIIQKCTGGERHHSQFIILYSRFIFD